MNFKGIISTKGFQEKNPSSFTQKTQLSSKVKSLETNFEDDVDDVENNNSYDLKNDKFYDWIDYKINFLIPKKI